MCSLLTRWKKGMSRVLYLRNDQLVVDLCACNVNYLQKNICTAVEGMQMDTPHLSLKVTGCEEIQDGHRTSVHRMDMESSADYIADLWMRLLINVATQRKQDSAESAGGAFLRKTASACRQCGSS
jgi:hypothetical protein